MFEWCSNHNLNFIDFKISSENIESFMKLIFKYTKQKEYKNMMRKYRLTQNNKHLEMSLFEFRF